MEDTKGNTITNEDMELYKGVLDTLSMSDDEIVAMIVTWEKNTPLRVYGNGTFDTYRGGVLDIIFNLLKEQFENLNKGYTGEHTREMDEHCYYDSKGKCTWIEFKENQNEPSVKVNDVSVNRFIEFINWYLKDTVTVLIDETMDTVDENYYMGHHNRLEEIAKLLQSEAISMYYHEQGVTKEYVLGKITGSLKQHLENKRKPSKKLEDGMYLYKHFKNILSRIEWKEQKLNSRTNELKRG